MTEDNSDMLQEVKRRLGDLFEQSEVLSEGEDKPIPNFSENQDIGILMSFNSSNHYTNTVRFGGIVTQTNKENESYNSEILSFSPSIKPTTDILVRVNEISTETETNHDNKKDNNKDNLLGVKTVRGNNVKMPQIKKIDDYKNKKFLLINLQRKNKKDEQQKKLKSHLFKYYLKLINDGIKKVVQGAIKDGNLNKLFPEGNIPKNLKRKIHLKEFLKKMKFTGISQNFIMNVNRENERKYINLTYRQLLEKNFDTILEGESKKLYKKKNECSHMHNLEVLKFLDDHTLLKEKSGFEKISNMTYIELYKSYLESDEFKFLLNKMIYMEITHYIDKFVKTAEGFLNFKE